MIDDARIDPDCVRYGTRDVARLVFAKSYDWFVAHRRALTAVHGFPRPISPIGHPHWSGRALLDWLHRDQTAKVATGDNVITLVRARTRKAFPPQAAKR